MPIFDYSCEACGHTFDILQKLGADPLVECPECGQPKLKKLLSAPAFHLKGKGWRNSDDAPKKPDVRPKFAHTLDSAVPHAEHTHDGPAKSPGKAHDHKHGHSHGHSHGDSHGHSHDHQESGGGLGAIARKAVESKGHGHTHDHSKDKGHSHGHTHGHSHGHKHKHDH